MLRYTARRLLGAIPTLLVIVTLAFLLLHMAPGGPFDANTGHYLDNIVAYALPARPDSSP